MSPIAHRGAKAPPLAARPLDRTRVRVDFLKNSDKFFQNKKTSYVMEQIFKQMELIFK